jgi:hypothetical protein
MLRSWALVRQQLTAETAKATDPDIIRTSSVVSAPAELFKKPRISKDFSLWLRLTTGLSQRIRTKTGQEPDIDGYH